MSKEQLILKINSAMRDLADARASDNPLMIDLAEATLNHLLDQIGLNVTVVTRNKQGA